MFRFCVIGIDRWKASLADLAAANDAGVGAYYRHSSFVHVLVIWSSFRVSIVRVWGYTKSCRLISKGSMSSRSPCSIGSRIANGFDALSVVSVVVVVVIDGEMVPFCVAR